MGAVQGELTQKQVSFVKAKIAGYNNKDAAIKAGYSAKAATVTGSKLMKEKKILQVLDSSDLTDARIARDLRKAIDAGLGEKATNGDALRGIELAFKLKGHLDRVPESMTQNNIYVNELIQMDDSELSSKVEELTKAVSELQG